MSCEINEYVENCKDCGFCDTITKNKTVELPCFIGDKVYYVQFQTSANINADRTPKVIEMTVEKVTYEAKENLERIRIDTSYFNTLGDKSYDWFIWADGFLHSTKQEAEFKVSQYIKKAGGVE